MRPAVRLLLVGLALLLLPYLLPRFWVFVAVEVAVFALYAVSLNLLLGYGGMLSFGHPAYFGIGAYAAALLAKKAGASMLAAFLAAPFAAAGAAALIGLFCVRITGIYFAMLTFAFQMLVYTIVMKSQPWTGGDDGISGLHPAAALSSGAAYYYFTAGVVVAALVVLHRVVNSPFGYAVRAVRSNPTRSRSVGINVVVHRWLMFVLAGFFAGLAGALYAFANGSVFPAWLNWTASAAPIIMAALGGVGTFIGPVLGAAVYVSLETFVTRITEYWPLVIGAILVVLVIAMPNGLTGIGRGGGRP